MMPLDKVLNFEAFKTKIGDNVKFFFGDSLKPQIDKNIGQIKTSRKTNAANKSDEFACEWAFLSAVIALKSKAQRDGADAVIEIKSNYRNNEVSSNDSYECHVGAFVAGVALKGTLVKLAP